ncbi:uncharacterized protein LOC144139853 [Haemaphysalis longicornis]
MSSTCSPILQPGCLTSAGVGVLPTVLGDRSIVCYLDPQRRAPVRSSSWCMSSTCRPTLQPGCLPSAGVGVLPTVLGDSSIVCYLGPQRRAPVRSSSWCMSSTCRPTLQPGCLPSAGVGVLPTVLGDRGDGGCRHLQCCSSPSNARRSSRISRLQQRGGGRERGRETLVHRVSLLHS